MNHNMTQGAGGPLARIGRRVATIVAECNHTATRVTILRNTPSLSDRDQRPASVRASAPDPGPRRRTNRHSPGHARPPAWFLQRFSDLADGPVCPVWPTAGSVLLTKKLIIAGWSH